MFIVDKNRISWIISCTTAKNGIRLFDNFKNHIVRLPKKQAFFFPVKNICEYQID